jgi:hypothetical protein
MHQTTDSHKIDIKAESFPWQGKLVGILFVLTATAMLTTHWWLSVVLTLPGLWLLTGYSGTELDRGENAYREYNSYFLIKAGKWQRYNRVEKIFVNASNESEKMYTAHTMESMTFRRTVFNAFLKFDNGEKIFLLSRKNKGDLINKIRPVVDFLDTKLVDYTGKNAG